MQNYGMGYYNPMFSAQQRLNYLEQQYPQYTQNHAQNQQQVLNTIPVSDIAEANAYRVDLNGTPTIFYNAGKNEFYLKRFNMQSGGADFFKYARIEEPQNDVKNKNEVNAYEKDFKALNEKIDGLYSLLKPTETMEEVLETKKAGKNAK